MTNEAALHSQHIAGKQNIIADSLSQYLHIPDETLTNVLSRLYYVQEPLGLKMQTLKIEIISWVYSLKDMSTNRKAYTVTRTPSATGALIDG